MKKLVFVIILFVSCTEDNKFLIDSLKETNNYLNEGYQKNFHRIYLNIEQTKQESLLNKLENISSQFGNFEADLLSKLSDSLEVALLEKEVGSIFQIKEKSFNNIPKLSTRILDSKRYAKNNSVYSQILINEYYKYKIDLINLIASSLSINLPLYDPELDIIFDSRKINIGDTLKAKVILKIIDFYLVDRIETVTINENENRKIISNEKGKIQLLDMNRGIHKLKGNIRYINTFGNIETISFDEDYIVE